MKDLVLITGGGGFLGVCLSQTLLESGYRVRILDNLSEGIHGAGAERPLNLPEEAEFIKGDIRNKDNALAALSEVDIVIHLASIEGIHASMFIPGDYIDNNTRGASVLIELLARKPVKKLIVASSMAVYGEGLYIDRQGRPVQDAKRSTSNLAEGIWNIMDYGEDELKPVATPETKSVNPVSVYGLSKYNQEKLCMLGGDTFGFPVTVLRFFNIYGPGQSLSNPGGDVLAKFGARLLNNVAPLLFEDGFQLRDFIHVSDAARACLLAMETPEADHQIFNIGSGEPCAIREVALKLALIMAKNRIQPKVSRKYRIGDVRNCFADIGKARKLLNFHPTVDLHDGMLEMAEWLKGQVGSFVYREHRFETPSFDSFQ